MIPPAGAVPFKHSSVLFRGRHSMGAFECETIAGISRETFTWTWDDYRRTAEAEERRARAREQRARLQQLGAEGRQGDASPARVPCVTPSAAAPGSGYACDLEAHSLTLAPAVLDPRTVAPAAGPSPRVGEGPAAALSPGLRWAWAMLEKGVSREKLLRTAGDRLTFRDRAELTGGAPAGQPQGAQA